MNIYCAQDSKKKKHMTHLGSKGEGCLGGEGKGDNP